MTSSRAASFLAQLVHHRSAPRPPPPPSPPVPPKWPWRGARASSPQPPSLGRIADRLEGPPLPRLVHHKPGSLARRPRPGPRPYGTVFPTDPHPSIPAEDRG